MKLLLVLLAIIAIAFATPIGTQIMQGMEKVKEVKDHYEKAVAGLNNVRHHMRMNHEEFLKQTEAEKIQEKVRRASRVISPTCLSALANLTIGFECRFYVNQYFNSANAANRSAAVDNYCSTCAADFDAKIRVILQNCTRDDLGDVKADFYKLGYYNRFLCAKEGNEFCAKTLINLDRTILSKAFDQVTSDDLNKVCSACVQKALRISLTGAGFNNGTLELYTSLRVSCVQIKGEYCVLKIKAAADAAGVLFTSGRTPSSSDFEKFLNIVCYPCFRAVLFRIISIGGATQLPVLAEVGTIFSKLCRKDQSGKYCIVRLFNTINNLLTSQTARIPCGNGTCDGTCKDFVNKLVDNGGCCWALLVDFATLSGVGASESDEIKRQFYQFVRSCTGRNLPPPCPSAANGTLTIRYTNLDITVVNKDLTRFRTLVLLDLQSAFGNLDGYTGFSIQTGNTKRAGETQTNVTITGAVVPGTAAGSLTDTQIPCDSVCLNIPPNDPSADVSVSNSASNLKVESASSSLSVSFLLLAGLFVLQFFF